MTPSSQPKVITSESPGFDSENLPPLIIAPVYPLKRSTPPSPVQAELTKLYREAKLASPNNLECNLDISEVVNDRGQFKSSFLLPVGTIIGEETSIGIGRGTSAIKITSLLYSEEAGGFFVSLKFERDQIAHSTRILISGTAEGRAALFTELQLQQSSLLEAYRIAKKNGIYVPESPIPIWKMIDGSAGRTQCSFILPNGKEIEKRINTPLERGSKQHELLSITYRHPRYDLTVRAKVGKLWSSTTLKVTNNL